MPIGLSIGLGIGSASGGAAQSGYEFANAEAESLVARFSSEPTDTRKELIDTCIGALKSGSVSGSNVWAKLDTFYMLAAQDSQAALRNWIADSDNASEVNSPSFEADRGYTGVGSPTSARINTGRASADSGNLSQNSASFGAWSLTSLQSDSGIVGDGRTFGIIPHNNSDLTRAFISDFTALEIATDDVDGLWVGNRSGSSARQLYRNGVEVGSDTQASGSTASNEFAICANSQSFPDEHQVAFAFTGGSLTADEVTDLYNAVGDYLVGVGAISTTFNPDNPLLRWSPPTLESPVTLTTGTGFYQSPIQADDQDVIVELPASIRNNGSVIEIRGGRNVVIKGGHTRGRLFVKDFTGSLYIEGVEIDLSGAANSDAFAFHGKSGTTPDVTIQNCWVTGVQGTNAGFHADVIQPYGDIGHLRIDKLTFDSNYQGIFIRPEHLISRATISRVNGTFNALGTPDGNTALLWFRNLISDNAAPGDPLYPVDLTECYAEANDTQTTHAAAWPFPGTEVQGEPTPQAYAGVADGSGNLTWPAGSGISGTVYMGAPAGGDFVAAEDVGVGYTPATEFQGA